jgi:outer membrane protein
VSAAESAASGQAAYSPGASTVPMVGLAATLPISGPWAVQLQWRHRWLDDAIRRSPIVATGSLDSGHVALTYEFK